MAGGEIPPDIFADYTTNDTQLLGIVEQVITDRPTSDPNLADGSED